MSASVGTFLILAATIFKCFFSLFIKGFELKVIPQSIGAACGFSSSSQVYFEWVFNKQEVQKKVFVRIQQAINTLGKLYGEGL